LEDIILIHFFFTHKKLFPTTPHLAKKLQF
jgi:hypothetical protein